MKKTIGMLLCVLFLLTGCYSGLNTEQETEQTAQTEQEQIELSVQMLQNLLRDTLAEEEEETDQVPNYLIEMDARRTVQVLSYAQLSESHAEVKVTVSAPDLYSVIKKLENETFTSEAEMDAALTEGVKAVAPITKELTLNAYLDGEWSFVLTEEFMDACYGGILTLRQEYYDAVEGVG